MKNSSVFKMKIKPNPQVFKQSKNFRIANKKPSPKQIDSNESEAECSLSGALVLAFRMSQIVGIAPVMFERRCDGCRVRVSRVLTIWSLMFVTALTNKKPSPKQIDSNESEAECSLSGALVLAFRMSQIVGIAPVMFERRCDGCRVRVSRVLTIWSLMFVTALIALACAAFCIDLSEPPQHSARAFSTTRRYVWIFDFIVVLNISCLGAYRAPKRSRTLIRCLGQIQKINFNLNVSPRPKKSEERKKYFAFMLFAVLYVTAVVLDFLYYYNQAKDCDNTGVQVTVTYLYSGYYHAYIILFALEAQFIFCALEIYRTMKSLNNLLEEILQAVILEHTQVLDTYSRINVVSKKALNQIIDSMTLHDTVYSEMSKSSSKMMHETIRYLALMYHSACDAVGQLNQCFAPELMALLVSFLMHLIVTPYNCIVNISGDKINVMMLLRQLIWCTIHLLCTVVIVEPCHITQDEIGRTNFLVSQLMLQNTDELVRVELNAFGLYLSLNKVAYSPMGVFVLARSLVASIIGTVTTYLVIIIQFQALESKG